MSLLEDVFLGDEAGEARDLERVIEGYEDEEPRGSGGDDSDAEPGSDEAVEEKRRVDPSEGKPRRVVKNPRFTLNPARLTGPRGIHIIPEHFKDFKFKGKGHEKEDLDLVLKKLEHWAYRLYPKFKFDDCLKKIETLGKKREVAVNLHKIRTDQFVPPVDTVTQQDSSDSEAEGPAKPQAPEEDEFDRQLQQQIEIARSTPGHNASRQDAMFDSVRGTPVVESNRGFQTPRREFGTPMTAPHATSSPSISEEQRQRMIRNRQMAEEKRLARLKQNTPEVIVNADNDTAKPIENSDSNDAIAEESTEVEENNTSGSKRQRANVIDSSDDESDVVCAKQSITVDVHKTNDIEMVHSKEEVDEDNTSFGKRHKSHVIDSSDEDEVMAVNESISVDVHIEHDDSAKRKDKINRKPVEDNLEDDVATKSAEKSIDKDSDVTNDNKKSSVDYKTMSVNKENIDRNIDIDEAMNVDS